MDSLRRIPVTIPIIVLVVTSSGWLLTGCDLLGQTQAEEGNNSMASTPDSTNPPANQPSEEPNGNPTVPVELDMREANILDVQIEQTGAGTFRFDVTLVHDDLAEAPDFANWWVVEDLNGAELGKRVLLHSHGNQPFTRSETISIPAGVQVVIVRGHDMQHGYGGQAMRVDLLTGEVEAIQDRD